MIKSILAASIICSALLISSQANASAFSDEIAFVKNYMPKQFCTNAKTKAIFKQFGVSTDNYKACFATVKPVTVSCINGLIKSGKVTAKSSSDASGQLIGSCVVNHFASTYKKHETTGSPAFKAQLKTEGTVITETYCTTDKGKAIFEKIGLNVKNTNHCLATLKPIAKKCITQLVSSGHLTPQTARRKSGELIGGCIYEVVKMKNKK